MTTRAYHTTPIYYVNSSPHVGHAYTTLAADALTRARRLLGQEVFFLTGTDEHGQNIERIARERGIGEQQHCDEYAARFRALWQTLDVRYDDFIRTTEERHVRGVLALWQRLTAATGPDGQRAIYRGTYAGWYCPRCEGFKDEEDLRQPGHVCPDHELPCEWTEEQNFFFRLSAYAGWLEEEIRSGRLKVEPDARRNELLSVIGQGLKDFSVSRARVKWGIPVPEQPDHVLYVWVDALSNYVTALGLADEGPRYRQFWAGGGERLHLMGKDIIRFHCLYWPALLKAAGLPWPSRIAAHGFITKNGRKLSKTTGNVIDPEALVAEHGPDAVRYFLLREGTYGQDWDFTDQAFVTRFNADLANDYGNLVSRALTMVGKYCGGRVPARPAGPGGAAEAFEQRLQAGAGHFTGPVLQRYEALDFSGALAETWTWIAQLNQRIVAVEPWVLAKDPSRKGELEAFLYRLLEGIRLATALVSPVMPRAAGRVLGMLGLERREPQPADLAWGRLEPGAPLGAVEPLFPRLEKEKSVSDQNDKPVAAPVPEPAPAAAPAPAPEAGPVQVTIDDFGKLDLRVARVLAAERIPKADKLLKLQVDLGSEQRQVVAGIAEAYTPEQLVGRQVVLVANLKPAKLRGVESQGMVLAASLDGKAVLCGFDRDVPPGTKVK